MGNENDLVKKTMKISHASFETFSRIIFYFIFFLSGLAGLVYESIWSHYLALFLGHAAYAQTLVLIIFMGGLALGAYLAGIFSKRIPSLLLAYALVEFIIGILGLIFHPIFVHSTNFIFYQILPNLHSVWGIMACKWGVGTLLILPQAILLGMTFPLMSGALLRRDPKVSGTSLSLLYFSNSLGAAIGVLLSGFYLIHKFGLPGTIFVAGSINIVVAVATWVLARLSTLKEDHRIFPETKSKMQRTSMLLLLLFTAGLTGASSFMYEIAWIRLLVLVLGASIHAFELMLSSFILGLALGSLFIKNRIDHLAYPVRYLGIVQILMGIFALLSLVLYAQQFRFMSYILSALTATDTGYLFFNLASHAISLIVMLPATFCAGMTLPLITAILLRSGFGEKSIGETYAANTLGSVIGIAVAVHVAMVLFQLKGLLILGAAIDVFLGVYLLSVHARHRFKAIILPTAISTLSLVLCFLFVNLSPAELATGLFHDKTPPLEGGEILFARTGKTANVDVGRINDVLSIRTNGKPDASFALKGKTTPDEATQILLPILPLSIHPQAKSMAVIGFGSGISSHIALEFSNLQRVDTIEIEPMMVEGAKLFLPYNQNVFTHPQSHIYFEDAKTFFSSHPFKYDIIISEPSNPWVSGVAGLFTVEFYQHINHFLSKDGLFCQWIHLYELDTSALASVARAIEKSFTHYSLYATNSGDVLFIASNNGEIPLPGKEIFSQTKVLPYLKRIGILTLDDLYSTILGNRAIYSPLFNTYNAPINSDFFPYLELNASKAHFTKNSSHEIIIATSYLPLDILTSAVPRLNPANLNPQLNIPRAKAASTSYNIYLTLLGQLPTPAALDEINQLKVLTLDTRGSNCEHPLLRASLQQKFFELGVLTSFLLPEETRTFWAKVEEITCPSLAMDPTTKSIVQLFQSIAARNFTHMLGNSLTLLQNQNFNLPKIQVMLLNYAAIASIAQHDYQSVLVLAKRFSNLLSINDPFFGSFRLLVNLAYVHEKI
jgi:spermidine synthase